MRAVLRCDGEPGGPSWAHLLLETRVAGLTLLRRHLLALRSAGIDRVALVVPRAEQRHFARALGAAVPPGITLRLLPGDRDAGGDSDVPVLEQRADTVVDPRLLAQLVRLASDQPGSVVCFDRRNDAGGPESKSPYRLGVPVLDEAKPMDAGAAGDGHHPIGLQVADPAQPRSRGLDIGRYYWLRIRHAEDARVASRMVLLSTMKATDGMWARTNRRVSLRITRLLVDTSITPNMVTLAVLAFSALAGAVLAAGSYPALVAGSLIAWFASMLDGVDGELARATFQVSARGHWLEMTGDFASYVFLVLGFGAGFTRATGGRGWLDAGVAAAAGVVLSFLAVARMKRRYARRGEVSNFLLAFQQTVAAPRSNVLDRISPYLASLMTRAVLPYYVVLFTVLGLAKLAFVLICIGAHGCWIWALYASRLQIVLDPAAPARGARLRGASPAPGLGGTPL